MMRPHLVWLIFLPLLLWPVMAGSQDEATPCLSCHSAEGSPFEEITQKGLTVDPAVFGGSVHGSFECVVCHETRAAFPHEATSAPVDPSFQPVVDALKLKASRDPMALASCIKCHYETFEDVRGSVHGQALFERGEAEAAYCLDCHGPAHEQLSRVNEKAATYRANIPQVCASCHGDTEIITKYRLNTYVVETYQESYHGKKLILGSSNVAVCTSCHGVHQITSPQAAAFLDNLAQVCGQCHEGASPKFAKAFAHIPLSKHGQKIAYYVRAFFITLIIIVALGLAGHASLDAITNLRLRLRRRKERDVRTPEP